MKLPLIDIEWDVLCSGFGFFFHFPSHTYGWICWDTNDAYLVRRPLLSDRAWSHESAIRRGLVWHYFLPVVYQVSYGYTFEGSAFYFLVDHFGRFVRIEFDCGHSASVIYPRLGDLADHFVAVMVKEHASDFIQSGQIDAAF